MKFEWVTDYESIVLGAGVSWAEDIYCVEIRLLFWGFVARWGE